MKKVYNVLRPYPQKARKELIIIARNDGVDRTVVRNAKNKKAGAIVRERHNERKNEVYSNPDIMLEKSNLNVHFKKCEDTYAGAFDKLCETGVISLKGLKKDSNVIDEMIFDVNTAYFEINGGYEYAKQFYAHAYQMAVKEIGGEQYILSAVMHADERNKSLSEELGKDVFHYHLHVVYVPVVQKEVLWTKRCKDKLLIGTVKEVITQVSHSKKWSSEKYKDELGRTKLISSYSKLQDRFFEYMSGVGYHNIERGEKGSKEENLHHAEFKAMKEKERLEQLQSKVKLEEKNLVDKQLQVEMIDQKLKQEISEFQEVKSKKISLKNIDDVSTKNAILDSSKVVVDKADFEDIKFLAKKQIVHESKEKSLAAKNAELVSENNTLNAKASSLSKQNSELNNELKKYKSVRNQLTVANLQDEIAKLRRFKEKCLEFIAMFNLKQKFDNFMYKNKERER